MKKIFENWKKYLIEDMYEPRVYTFDFDNTIMMTRPDDDWGEVVDGPNDKIIKLMRKYKKNGDRVIVVTSRHQHMEKRGTGGHPAHHPAYMPSVEEFTAKHNIPYDAIVFTSGNMKVQYLLKTRSDLHYDDDEQELAAANEAGINTIQVRNVHFSQVPEEEQ